MYPTAESRLPLWIRFVLFFGALSVALSFLNAYVHSRASRVLGLSKRGRRALAVALIASGLMLVGGRLLGRVAPSALAEWLAILGFTVQLAVLIAAPLMWPVELGRAVDRLLVWLGRRRSGAVEPPGEPAADDGAVDDRAPPDAPGAAPPAPRLGRREVVTRAAYGGALLIGSSHSVYGALLGRHDYVLDDVPVALPGLPRALDGYTIVQISDIHFGTFVGEPQLRIAEDLVRRARPDLVVLTGDLVDHDPRYAELVGQLARRVGPLARDGVAAITGNHDYYAGVDAVVGALRAGGADVLRNEGRVLGDPRRGFALVGVDDVWAARNGFGGGPDLDRALGTVPADAPTVLLCHNPVFFPEAAGRVGLMLSGHTHGGQVSVGFNPAALVLPYVRGRYDRDGSTLYVNRGFGTAGPPARVGSPPEVSRIVLTAG